MWLRALFEVWLPTGNERFQTSGTRAVHKLSHGRKVGHLCITLSNIEHEKMVIKSGTMGAFFIIF